MNSKTYHFERFTEQLEQLPGAEYYYYKDKNFLLAEYTAEGMILGQEKAFELLNEHNIDFLLVSHHLQEQQELYFFSRTRMVRALEFLGYLLEDSGLVKGDAAYAQGQISLVMLRVYEAEKEIYDTLQYIMYRVEQYFNEIELVDAARYAKEHEKEIRSMVRYAKKQEKWFYVKTLDIVEAGKKICIKTLENESGVIVTANEDTYIMIGCRGEVYDIARDKFEQTYEMSDEPLDVFEQMLYYIPAVETVPEGEYISLDELARVCYPVSGNEIYARQLTKRTKVFSIKEEQGYFLGDAGDYMAIRTDDYQDIYIIKKDIFEGNYELAGEKQ